MIKIFVFSILIFCVFGSFHRFRFSSQGARNVTSLGAKQCEEIKGVYDYFSTPSNDRATPEDWEASCWPAVGQMQINEDCSAQNWFVGQIYVTDPVSGNQTTFCEVSSLSSDNAFSKPLPNGIIQNYFPGAGYALTYFPIRKDGKKIIGYSQTVFEDAACLAHCVFTQTILKTEGVKYYVPTFAQVCGTAEPIPDNLPCKEREALKN